MLTYCFVWASTDREMADVDVTTPGVWSRSSDVDFYEALAAEDEEDRQLAAAVNNGDSSVEGVGTSKQHYHLGRSPQSPAAGSTSFFNAQGSEESGYAASASGASVDRARNSKLQHGSRKKRVGRGEALLAPSLKAWNGMVRALAFAGCLVDDHPEHDCCISRSLPSAITAGSLFKPICLTNVNISTRKLWLRNANATMPFALNGPRRLSMT